MDPLFSNIIIIAILFIVLLLAFKSSISHFSGEGSCCGGGSRIVKDKTRKIKNADHEIKIHIDGMHCINCYTRVHNILNSINGCSATVYGKKGVAVVKYENKVDKKQIVETVERLGYKVVTVEEKL